MCPRLAHGSPPALHAVAFGPPLDILKLCARNAWWKLERAVLSDVAELEGIDISGATSTFDVLLVLTKVVLGVADEEALVILQQRLKALDGATTCADDILAVDEAAQCLREEDVQELKSTQKKAADHQAHLETFQQQFHCKAAIVKATDPRGNGPKIKWKGPKVVPAGHLSQAQAKQYMPPNSYIWRARASNAWRSRWADMPVKECGDSVWCAPQGSMWACVRHAWQWYLLCSGLTEKDCPIGGLFEAPGP